MENLDNLLNQYRLRQEQYVIFSLHQEMLDKCLNLLDHNKVVYQHRYQSTSKEI